MNLLLDSLKQNQFDRSTRSSATEKNYIVRAEWAVRRSLVLKFGATYKKSVAALTSEQLKAIPAALVLEQMLEQKDGWAQATWRQVKAALMFYYSVILFQFWY